MYHEYVAMNGNKDGEQKSAQLTATQATGRLKLAKRVGKGEIVISPSDKGKGIVIMPIEMYEMMAREHIGKDIEVGWDELKR